MNTNEVRCILSRDKKTKQKFINVFALDEFKSFVQKHSLLEGLYVINDETSDLPGQHWLSIFYENNYLAFVDSFAKNPEDYNLLDELSRANSNDIKVSPYRLQNLFSDYCGEYIIYFAYHLYALLL